MDAYQHFDILCKETGILAKYLSQNFTRSKTGSYPLRFEKFFKFIYRHLSLFCHFFHGTQCAYLVNQSLFGQVIWIDLKTLSGLEFEFKRSTHTPFLEFYSFQSKDIVGTKVEIIKF